MSFVINTNLSATTAHLQTNRSLKSIGESLQKLSTGKRVDSSADDAGGLSVAQKLSSKMSRTSAALQNAQNALSYLQVQDGFLESMGKILGRFGELRTIAQDVTKNSGDIENYNHEFMELQRQLESISNETYNGINLFIPFSQRFPSPDLSSDPSINQEKDAFSDHHSQWWPTGVQNYDKYSRTLTLHPDGQSSSGSVSLGIINVNHVLSTNMKAIHIKSQGKDLERVGVGRWIITNIRALSLGLITNAIERLADARAENGAEQNAVQNAFEQLRSSQVGMENARGRIVDADMANETTRLTKSQIMREAGVSMHAQANRMTYLGLTIMGLSQV